MTNLARASRTCALICLAAFLMMGIAANVHTHQHISLLGSAWSSYDTHSCSACDLYYSGAGHAKLTPICYERAGVVALSIGQQQNAAPSQADISRYSSRAPPSI